MHTRNRPQPRCRARHGAVLLEVIVALAILSVSALSAVILTRQAMRSVERAHAADVRMQAANAFLTVVSLWPREDLDLRIGDHPQGQWMLHIDRSTRTLYRIALYDAGSNTTDGTPILETALFRANRSNAAP